MNINLRSITLLSLLLSGLTTSAQNLERNVFDLAKDNQSGTSRFRAMGSVQTALGGDISSISGNPAGLGFFGQSDVSITLNSFNNLNKATYFGQNTSTNQNKIGIDNAGIVIYYPTSNDPDYGWQNMNIGLSFDRQNNFAEKLTYKGINDQNTIVQFLTDEMYFSPSFQNDFAKSYLVERFNIPTNPDLDGYFPTVLEADPKAQQRDFTNTGYKYRSNISIGANYGNKFYIGGSLGLINYKSNTLNTFYERGWTKKVDEIRPDNPNSDFLKPGTTANKYTDINYAVTDRYEVETTATGANFTFGIIYKPRWDWNLGVNFSSPSWLAAKQEDWISTDANYYQDEKSENSILPAYKSNVGGGALDYEIITPWKAAVGITKFYGRGLFSADVEYVDYTYLQYTDLSESPDIKYENEINNKFKNQYQGAVNIRVGTEFLFTDRFTGRAGFNYLSSPEKNFDNSEYIVNLGLGYVVSNSFYIDVAASQFISQPYTDEAYSLEKVWQSTNPTVSVSRSATNVSLTLGVKF